VSDAPSPAPTHRLRTLGVALLVVVALLVGAEAATRALSPHLPEPSLWADDSTATKVAQMDALADSQGCVDVVFAGNSMTRDGIDPAVFTASDPDGRTGYNAALDAATPELLQRWVPDEVVPRLEPDTVVIGLTSFDFNEGAAITASALDAYDSAPMTRDDLMGTLEQPLLEQSAIFRHRVELRDPQTVWESIGRWRRGEETEHPDPAGIPDLLGPAGQGLSRADLVYSGSAVAQQFVLDQLLNDYEPSDDQAAALAALVRDLRGEGTQVVLLLLPVTDDYVGLHPDGAADYEAFREEVLDLGDDQEVPVVDAHDWAQGDQEFADTHHLNAAGAARFSQELPAMLPEPATDTGC
jgi:hypothetical protein